MIGWVGGIGCGILALGLIFLFYSWRYSHQIRVNLRSYIIYLLLDDTIRNNHRRKFQDWINETDVGDALELSTKAIDVLENMADKLANAEESSSILASHAMLWNYKRNKN